MSKWCYITGWLEVQPLGRSQEEIEYVLKSVLKHLPIVSGSEGDMNVHIIKPEGHNVSCTHDEYDMYTDKAVDFDGYRSRHGWYQYQDMYYLFVDGRLRDCEFNETYRQLIKWITRLAKRIQVYYTDIKVMGDFHGYDVLLGTMSNSKTVRIETEDFRDLFIYPSYSVGSKNETEENWSEHLLWNHNPYWEKGD